jgi:hypothetical protein
MPRAKFALLAVASALALTGCGSGDADEKNDYVDQVNAVTQTLNEDLAEVAGQGTSATSPSAPPVSCRASPRISAPRSLSSTRSRPPRRWRAFTISSWPT